MGNNKMKKKIEDIILKNINLDHINIGFISDEILDLFNVIDNKMTSDELSDLFINEFFYPDIQAKGINEEAKNMRNFVKNWLEANINIINNKAKD